MFVELNGASQFRSRILIGLRQKYVGRCWDWRLNMYMTPIYTYRCLAQAFIHYLFCMHSAVQCWVRLSFVLYRISILSWQRRSDLLLRVLLCVFAPLISACQFSNNYLESMHNIIAYWLLPFQYDCHFLIATTIIIFTNNMHIHMHLLPLYCLQVVFLFTVFMLMALPIMVTLSYIHTIERLRTGVS